MNEFAMLRIKRSESAKLDEKSFIFLPFDLSIQLRGTEKKLKDSDQLLEVLRKRIRNHLSSANGWRLNCRTGNEFRWTDFFENIEDFKDLGIYSLSSDDIPDEAINPLNMYDIKINTAELLTMIDHHGTLNVKTKDGNERLFMVSVNMCDGDIELSYEQHFKDLQALFDDENIESMWMHIDFFENMDVEGDSADTLRLVHIEE